MMEPPTSALLSGVARSFDGTEIVFQTLGSRERPAVFLGPHFYVTRANPDPYESGSWIERLAQDFFLIVADYPRGIGSTGNQLGAKNTPDAVAEDYLAIAAAACVDRFGWVGYSYGAAIGVQLACRTNRLTALAIGGFPPLNAPFRFMVDMTERAVRSRSRRFAQINRAYIRSINGFYRALLEWPERDEVAMLQLPRLVFMGTEDGRDRRKNPWAVPLAPKLQEVDAELVAQGWRVEWLRGCDHMDAIRADVSAALVHSFLRAVLTEQCKP